MFVHVSCNFKRRENKMLTENMRSKTNYSRLSFFLLHSNSCYVYVYIVLFVRQEFPCVVIRALARNLATIGACDNFFFINHVWKPILKPRYVLHIGESQFKCNIFGKFREKCGEINAIVAWAHFARTSTCALFSKQIRHERRYR